MMKQLSLFLSCLILLTIVSCSHFNYNNQQTLVEPKKNVMLIHGVLMNPIEMRYLGNQLEKSGFKVHYVFYQSVLKTAAENAQATHQKIQKLQLPNLHIVGHSLGGIITMHLLSQFNDIPAGRVVMLGSPVNGSWIAQKVQDWPIISPLLAKSMPSALSGEDIPAWGNQREWGMIAGSKNSGLGLLTGGLPGAGDGTVLIEETKHPKQTAHVVVNKSHTGLLFSKQVAILTGHFLKTGSFVLTDH